MIKKIYSLLLIAVFLLSLCACAKQASPSLSDAYLQAAQQHIDAGDFDSAISVLEEAIKVVGGDVFQQKLEEVLQLKNQHATPDLTLYTSILEETKTQHSEYLLSCGYLLYDMDTDAVPELIVKQATYGSDAVCFVYTIKNGAVASCGSFYGENVCGLNGHAGLIMVSGRQLVEHVQRILITDGSIIQEEVFTGAVEKYHPFTSLEWQMFDQPISLQWEENPTDGNYAVYESIKAGTAQPTVTVPPSNDQVSNEPTASYTDFLGSWASEYARITITEESGKLSVGLGVGTGFFYTTQVDFSAIQDLTLRVPVEESSYDAYGEILIEFIACGDDIRLFTTVVDNSPASQSVFMKNFQEVALTPQS